MYRRNLLKLSSVAGLTLLLPKIGLADIAASDGQTLETQELYFLTEIGNNHGHELFLEFKEALHILRNLKANESAFFDIEGTAGHAHAIELNRMEVESIIWGAVVTKKTTIGAGHNHPFAIRLEV